MDTPFREFLESRDTLRILEGDEPVFTSRGDALYPLLDYLSRGGQRRGPVTVLDRTVGNAAALLAVRAGANTVFSPLGSQPAAETLELYQCAYTFTETVPFILARNGRDMCPMEKLSLTPGMSPEQFYETLRRRQGQPARSGDRP